jgi:hypothetical protein
MSISLLKDPQTRRSLGVGSVQLAGVAGQADLTWSPSAGGGRYSAQISVPSATATSIVTATIQTGSEADVLNNWLTNAVPSTGAITFFICNNGGSVSPPQTPATFSISWHLTNETS